MKEQTGDYKNQIRKLSWQIYRKKRREIIDVKKEEDDVGEYIIQLTKQKLQVKSHKPDEVMEVIESPVKRAAQLERERTLRRTSLIFKRQSKENIFGNYKISPHIIAKMSNDPEFKEHVAEGINLELFSAFVIKQMLNTKSLRIQCSSMETEQAAKLETLKTLQRTPYPL